MFYVYLDKIYTLGYTVPFRVHIYHFSHISSRATDCIPRRISRVPSLKFFFSLIIFLDFLFLLPLPPLVPQRPTYSYHANPAGSTTRNDMSLQVGEMPDSNLGLQVLQPAVLSLSHHIPQPWGCGGSLKFAAEQIQDPERLSF